MGLELTEGRAGVEEREQGLEKKLLALILIYHSRLISTGKSGTKSCDAFEGSFM